jgi:hypothetical protein
MKRGYSVSTVLILLLILSQGTRAQVFRSQFNFASEIKCDKYRSHSLFSNTDSLLKHKAHQERLRSSVEGDLICDSSIVETWDINSLQWVKSIKQVQITYQTGGNKLFVYNWYRWDKNSGTWQHDSKSEITYDANGYQIMYVGCHWDPVINEWAFGYKSTYSYDSNGVTGYCEYRWDAKARFWVPWGKSETTYDLNKSTSTTSWWNQNTNQWVLWEKYESTYNNNKLKTLSLVYTWNDLSNNWVFSNKTEQSWDDLGRNTMFFHSIWNVIGNQWDSILKSETSYDLSGNNSIKLTYIKDEANGGLILQSKYESEYDNNSKLIHEEGYTWDKSVNEWKYQSKTDYAYDPNGYRTLFDSYSWDNSTGSWINNIKIEDTYDTKGNVTLEVRSRTDHVTGEYIGESRLECVFDASGNQLSYQSFEWDWERNQFVFYEKGTSYYSGHSTGSELPHVINVYPNPAREYIVFDIVDPSDSAVAEIFDYHGKKVLEQKLPYPSEIYVNNLPRGLYFYRVKSAGKVYKGKIILQ